MVMYAVPKKTRPILEVPRKPLFIPLKSIYYDAFADGTKDTEWRLHGKRWNADTCPIGRDVIISRGYGKKNRMRGWIVGWTSTKSDYASVDAALRESMEAIYGVGPHDIIGIEIEFEPTNTAEKE